MAIFHRATITPTKEALLADWVPTQPWGPPADVALEVIGSYRFDDPDGRVGMETLLCSAGGAVLHVPLTYRDAPLEGGDDGLITEMTHSVLGNRWVYDGLRDPVYVVMLAAVTMTGQGEALGMVVYDDRWYVAPSNVRIRGGGWSLERVPVDGFVAVDGAAGAVAVLRNDRFELSFSRRPSSGAAASSTGMTLTGTWPGQDDPVVLATVEERPPGPG
jgi:hypothetical protein